MLRAIDGYIAEGKYNLAKTEIRYSELYKQATEQHRPVMTFAKNERPYRDYKAFAQELLSIIKGDDDGEK